MTNLTPTSSLHPFKVVLFDLGSTLIYFDGDWPEVIAASDQALIKALHQLGLTVDGERFIADLQARDAVNFPAGETVLVEHPTFDVVGELLGEHGYPGVKEPVLRQALATMYTVSQAHWHVEEDAAATLEALRRAGYRMGIVSNAGDDQDVNTLIDKERLRSYFDIILTSAAAGIRKPDPQIFRLALAHWDCPPEQAVMVGDTLGADILGAHNASMSGIWISRRVDTPANRAKLATIAPDAIIAQLSELPELLLRWL
jgi:HAD superfamily hydrolase (TIGR01549 family)